MSLRLESQRVELLAGCKRFVYTGGWDVGANGEAVLEGTLETTTASGTGSVPATLRLQFSEKEPASARDGGGHRRGRRGAVRAADAGARRGGCAGAGAVQPALTLLFR